MVTSAGRCGDLRSERSETGLHCGRLCVNELAPASESVRPYQRQVLIKSVKLK